MIKAAVLGSPITHSLSPVLHKKAYEILKRQASYEAIELLPEGAESFFRLALDEEWTGFSLTMPLKESVFNLGFEIEPVAQRMRSANTLFRQNGTFRASSTDRTGFIRLLDGVDQTRTAIIGGGGTARAALGALDGVAESVDFLLRTPARRDLLSSIARKSNVSFYGMDQPLHSYDLVIATVPSGASDHIADELDFQIPTLFEVLYTPYPTRLLAVAKSLGSKTFDGMDLLVEQAMDQIALFSGADFDRSSMRTALQEVGRASLS